MANFNQQAISGTEHQRCRQVIISNEYGQTPVVSFVRESVVILGDRHIASPIGPVTQDFTAENAGTEIDLVNPETGEPTGKKITYQDVYVSLYSLFVDTATRRDTQSELNAQALELQKQAAQLAR